MKNKIIVYIIVSLGLVAVVFLYARPDGNKGVSNGEITNSHSAQIGNILTAEQVFYDFGMISMKDGKVSKSFKVINSTNEDIKLPSLTTSCMCTAAYFIDSDGNKKGPFGMPGMGFVPKLNSIIKAGASGEVEVVYDPNAHGPAGVGMIDRFVYLEDENNNKLQFEIKANVTP